MSDEPRDWTTLERRRDINARFERMRRQSLVLFLSLALVLSGIGIIAHQNDVQCRATNVSNRAFNATLDQLIVSAASAQTLTPSQKLERVAKYRALHLRISDCPAL